MTGSIIFYTDGTCETIKLPWGAITGYEADLTKLESIKGNWNFEMQHSKKLFIYVLENLKLQVFKLGLIQNYEAVSGRLGNTSVIPI